MKPKLVVLIVFDCLSYLATTECGGDEDCDARWPRSFCFRGRCRCPADFVRKSSSSRGWICLSVKDAVTGEIGSPLTCPLPAGAGYNVIRRNGTIPVLCASRNRKAVETIGCPFGYECIAGHGVSLPLDGACCPDQENSCLQPLFDHENGPHLRWGWSGKTCVEFRWNPERPSTANNFLSKEHCESYCLRDNVLYAKKK